MPQALPQDLKKQLLFGVMSLPKSYCPPLFPQLWEPIHYLPVTSPNVLPSPSWVSKETLMDRPLRCTSSFSTATPPWEPGTISWGLDLKPVWATPYSVCVVGGGPLICTSYYAWEVNRQQLFANHMQGSDLGTGHQHKLTELTEQPPTLRSKLSLSIFSKYHEVYNKVHLCSMANFEINNKVIQEFLLLAWIL